MKRIILIITLTLLIITGCKKEVSIEKLNEINDKISEYFTSGGEYTNLSSHYVDEQALRVVVELANNSKDEQKYFEDNIVKSKYIKFTKGGPYTTSGLDIKNLETYIGGLIANQTITETTTVDELIEVDTSKIEYSRLMKNRSGDVALIVKTDDEDIIKTIEDYFEINYKGYKKGKIENNYVYVYNGYNDFDLEFKTFTGTIEEIREKEILITEENNEKYLVHYNINIDLNVGDKIKITFDGMASYSDPGQISAIYIEKEIN